VVRKDGLNQSKEGVMNEALERERGCEAKIRYKSKKRAENALRSIRKSGKIITGTPNAYLCRFCNRWHLGHGKGAVKKGVA
jgi:hypothetical protein